MGKLHMQAEVDRLNSVLEFRVKVLRLAEQERDLAKAERDAARRQASAAQTEIDRLSTALADSERMRVEAETALAEWRSGIAELGRVWKILRRGPGRPTPAMRELYGASTTPKETTHVEG